MKYSFDLLTFVLLGIIYAWQPLPSLISTKSVFTTICTFCLLQDEIVLACADQLLQIKHFLLR